MSGLPNIQAMTFRLTEIRDREARQVETLKATQAEAFALAAEIAWATRGAGPVLAWNDLVRIGDAVRFQSVETITRSWAWSDDSGQAVILVQGSTLPVPLDAVERLLVTA